MSEIIDFAGVLSQLERLPKPEQLALWRAYGYARDPYAYVATDLYGNGSLENTAESLCRLIEKLNRLGITDAAAAICEYAVKYLGLEKPKATVAPIDDFVRAALESLTSAQLERLWSGTYEQLVPTTRGAMINLLCRHRVVYGDYHSLSRLRDGLSIVGADDAAQAIADQQATMVASVVPIRRAAVDQRAATIKSILLEMGDTRLTHLWYRYNLERVPEHPKNIPELLCQNGCLVPGDPNSVRRLAELLRKVPDYPTARKIEATL